MSIGCFPCGLTSRTPRPPSFAQCAEIPYDTIANGHGPLLRRNTAELVGKYQSWSEQALKKAQAVVSLFYVSDYGFNDRLAQSIARGLTKTDVEVHMVDLNLAGTQEIVEAVGGASAVVVTMPPSTGRAHDMLGTVLASVKPKQKLMLAESYGGNDEPVDPLASSFASAGLELALPPLRVKDTPSEGTYQARTRRSAASEHPVSPCSAGFRVFDVSMATH